MKALAVMVGKWRRKLAGVPVAKRKRLMARVAGLGGVAVLAACAAPPAPATLSAPMTAAPTSATVAAVRAVSVAPADSGSLGVNAVLSALNQPALRVPASGREVVFVKRDGNAASLVVPASSLAPGAHVAVMSADTTHLVEQTE